MVNKIKKSNNLVPRMYYGIKRDNRGKVWIQCNDGIYRCHHSKITLTQEQMDSDLKNDCVREFSFDLEEMQYVFNRMLTIHEQ